jgi:secondary thiamine-phosphate synthase enzyme
MKQKTATLQIATRGPGFTDVTGQLRRFLSGCQIETGILTVFVPHTSCSLLIQENADPDVLRDLGDAFARFAPRDADYRHTTEGPDDMPAHIKSSLTAVSLSIPIVAGALALGVWQAVYLFEHRDAAHQRNVALHAIGE